VSAEPTESGGRVTVRCQIPEDADETSGYVVVSAQTRSSSPDSPPASLSSQFGVRATRSVDLAIRPHPLLVRFDKGTGSGTSRCLLRGDKLAGLGDGQELIESIQCPGFHVQWSVQQRPRETRLAVVELSLRQVGGADMPANPSLAITVLGGDRLTVPLFLVE
jgi:hypothetical protein